MHWNATVMSTSHHPAVKGLIVPIEPIYITALPFWSLMAEGWRFYIGEDGRVLGYMPPKLGDRIEQVYR